MSEARRQHPVAALSHMLNMIRDNIITIVLVFFVGGQQSALPFFSIWGFLGVLAVMLLIGVVSWWRFTYRVDEGELRIDRGLIVKQNLYIPRERIQVIDISAGVIERFFGLVSLNVQTASGAKNASISALTHEEAQRLRELLRPSTADREGSEEATSENSKTYRLSLKELTMAAATSGSIGVTMSILGTVLSQLDQFIPEQWIQQQAENVMRTGWMIIIGGLIVVLIAAVILAFLGTLIRFARFSLTVHDDRLVISQGLFERKHLTIPFKRIQAIRIHEGILRQPFGLASLHIDSAGFGRENGESTVLWPLMQKKNIQPFLSENLPEFAGTTEWQRPAPRAVKRYVFRSSLPAILFTILAGLTITYGWWAAMLLLPAAFWGWLRFHDAGAGVSGNRLFVRFRGLARTTVVLYRRRIQDAEVKFWNPGLRHSLYHLRLSIAAGRTGARFHVNGLDRTTALNLLQWCVDGHMGASSSKQREGERHDDGLNHPADGANSHRA